MISDEESFRQALLGHLTARFVYQLEHATEQHPTYTEPLVQVKWALQPAFHPDSASGSKILDTLSLKALMQRLIDWTKSYLTSTYQLEVLEDFQDAIQSSAASPQDLLTQWSSWKTNTTQFLTIYDALLLANIRLRTVAFLNSQQLPNVVYQWLQAAISWVPLIGPQTAAFLGQIVGSALVTALEYALDALYDRSTPATMRGWFLLPALQSVEDVLQASVASTNHTRLQFNSATVTVT